MFIKTQEFRQVNLGEPRRAFDFEQILVVVKYGVATHVGRTRIDDRRVRFGVDRDELVMHNHWGKRRRVFAGENVDLRLETCRSEGCTEEFRADRILLVARSMEEVEGCELIGGDISSICRRDARLSSRDTIDEPEHHLAGVTYRKTRLAQLFVSWREQTKDDRTTGRMNAGNDGLDRCAWVTGAAFFG